MLLQSIPFLLYIKPIYLSSLADHVKVVYDSLPLGKDKGCFKRGANCETPCISNLVGIQSVLKKITVYRIILVQTVCVCIICCFYVYPNADP